MIVDSPISRLPAVTELSVADLLLVSKCTGTNAGSKVYTSNSITYNKMLSSVVSDISNVTGTITLKTWTQTV